MRTLFIGGALGVLILSFAACGGSSTKSASDKTMQRQADLWSIDQIEQNFHKATSKKDIDLMMSLWAPNATFTTKPGQTLTGKPQIRRFWLAAPAFQPDNRWVSDTPAYKIRIRSTGTAARSTSSAITSTARRRNWDPSPPPIKRSPGSTEGG